MTYEPEHEAFRESFRAFIERDVRPLAGQILASAVILDKVFAVAGENGFLGACAPEEFGGAGTGDLRFALLAAEELTAAGLTGVALAFAIHSAVAIPLLVRYGQAEQHARWLPPMVSGELLAAVVGSPDAGVRLTPLASGQAGALLDGAADAVINVTRAGLLIAAARAGGGETRIAVVPGDAPGLVRLPAAGALGVPGADQGRAEFRSVFVADDRILAGSGNDQIAALRADERLAVAVIAVAGARTALAETLDYVRERLVFGRPVAVFQNTRYVLAGIEADLAIAGTYLEGCVSDRLAGRLDPGRAAAASLRCTELFTATADQCLQLHGGYGYMREYPISQAYADARYLRLHGGGSAAMKETLAAGLGLNSDL